MIAQTREDPLMRRATRKPSELSLMSPLDTQYPAQIPLPSKIPQNAFLETATTSPDQLGPGPDLSRPQSRKDPPWLYQFPPSKRIGREIPHTLHIQQYLASPRRPHLSHPSPLHPRQHHLGPLHQQTYQVHPGLLHHQISPPTPRPLHQPYLNTPPHSLTIRHLVPFQTSTPLPPATPVPTPPHPPPRPHQLTLRFTPYQNQTT